MPSSQGSTSTNTSSRAPISPFASANSESHYTSDDLPDLGAFNIVLREWNYFQPWPRILDHHQQQYLYTNSSTGPSTGPPTILDTDTDEAGRRSTVWNHEPIAEYLLDHDVNDRDDRTTESTDTEGGRSVEIETAVEDDQSPTRQREVDASTSSLPPDSCYSSSPLRTQPSLGDESSQRELVELEMEMEMDFQPSLGYLDEALGFIAAERARMEVQRASGTGTDSGQILGSRRRRRRRRPGKKLQAQQQLALQGTSPAASASHLTTSSDLDTIASNSQNYSYGHPEVIEEDDEDGEVSGTHDDGVGALAEDGLEDDEYEDSPFDPYPRRSVLFNSKSTPMTPRARPHLHGPLSPERAYVGVLSSDDLGSSASASIVTPGREVDSSRSSKPRRRRSRSKHASKLKKSGRSLSHSHSTPSLRALAEAQALAPYLSPLSVSLSPNVSSNSALSLFTAPLSSSSSSLRLNKKLSKHQHLQSLLNNPPKTIHPQTQLQLSGGVPPDPGALRLVSLARYMGQVFPAEAELLAGIERKLIVWAARRVRAGASVNETETKKSTKNPKGSSEESDEQTINTRDKEEDNWDPETELDPRGREPKIGDPPVHVFIDHSNILFGLLTYLRRHPSSVLRHTHHGTQEHAYLHPQSHHLQNIQILPHGAPLPTASTTTYSTTNTNFKSTTSTVPVAMSTPIPLPSFATAAHSLNLNNLSISPTSPLNHSPNVRHATKSKAKTKEKVDTPSVNTLRPIPMPASVSTSSDDILLLGDTRAAARVSISTETSQGPEAQKHEDDHHRQEDNTREEQHSSREVDHGEEGIDFIIEDDDNGDDLSDKNFEGIQPKEKRNKAKHLSHTALCLILERGRAISRRVVVASSPLYQPMDTMERLGYEVRIFIRVPDLGDGMDRREKGSHKHTHSKTDNLTVGTVHPTLKSGKGHARQLSGDASTDSANGEAITNMEAGDKGASTASASSSAGLTLLGTPPAHSQLSAYYQTRTPHTPWQSPGGMRIKYREQGVDELLQLKLHQVLAATDVVPDGATIVLATGDGNVGQFNEDGFLGPVRTALKRGWRVELYAWEDGLSRAWRKEFGAGSEWAKDDKFQIIGMEQFAASLVKGGL